MNDNEDRVIYKVIVNDEQQYSICPFYRENAAGWRNTGKIGTKADCLAYIEVVWTEMRPRLTQQRALAFYNKAS